MAAVLLAFAAVLISGRGTASASVLRLRGTTVGSPAWSGSQALVAIASGNGTAIELIEPPTGGTRQIAALPSRYAEARGMALGSDFALELIAPNYGGSKYEPPNIGDHELLLGQAAGPWSCLARLFSTACALPRLCVFGRAVASGPLLAYPSCENGQWEEAGDTVVFDSPLSQTQVVSQVALPLSLAGPWLVGLAPGWDPNQMPDHKAAPVLVERNLVTGSEPVRIPLAPWSHPASEAREALRTVAVVEEDGTMVYALATGQNTALWTASPSQPTPRQFLTIHASVGWLKEIQQPLALHDARIAFPDAERLYGPREIAIATLAGRRLGSLRVLAQDGWDYNGAQLLASSAPCGDSFLLVWAPGEPQPAVPSYGCSTTRIAHLRVTSRRILFELRCPEGPGCETGKITVTGGPISISEDGEQVMPNESQRLELTLSSSQRRWLRRHPRAKLSIRWENTRTRVWLSPKRNACVPIRCRAVRGRARGYANKTRSPRNPRRSRRIGEP
jgi:hypothetical protein